MCQAHSDIQRDIERLRKERNAVILAHLYQRPEVQDIADFTGDSLELSRKATQTEASVIVFCGVRFMAETASVLNPDRTVLLPEREAGCELADMASVEELKVRLSRLPEDTAVVSYVNSSAAVKAESDICCTSANAVAVVQSLPHRRVLFVPDRNLASFVAERVDKEIIPWDGYCYVHEVNITPAIIERLRGQHPDAAVMCHPECAPAARRLADFVGSTSQMLRFATQSDGQEFIVGTEDGIIHRLGKENPGKKFHAVGSTCEGMKRITLGSVKAALQELRFEVRVPEEIGRRARIALDQMLRI